MNTLEASREVEACALAKITIDNPNSKQRQKGLQISDMSQRHFCPARLETRRSKRRQSTPQHKKYCSNMAAASRTFDEAFGDKVNEKEVDNDKTWETSLVFPGTEICGRCEAYPVNSEMARIGVDIFHYTGSTNIFKGSVIRFDPQKYQVNRVESENKFGRDTDGWKLLRDIMTMLSESGQGTYISNGSHQGSKYVQRELCCNRYKLYQRRQSKASSMLHVDRKVRPTSLPLDKNDKCRCRLVLKADTYGYYIDCGTGNATHENHSRIDPKSTVKKQASKKKSDVLYHMCQKTLWETSVQKATAYFPPTFEQDGCFTHATAIPDRLLATANHFYTLSNGEWICVALSQKALRQVGIVTKYEAPMAVGTTETNHEWAEQEYECPHIYGGIPVQIPGIVLACYPMQRDETTGQFLAIPGLTDVRPGSNGRRRLLAFKN